jgi:hypothetical protein
MPKLGQPPFLFIINVGGYNKNGAYHGSGLPIIGASQKKGYAFRALPTYSVRSLLLASFGLPSVLLNSFLQ